MSTNHTALQFLRLILPHQGFLGVWTNPPKTNRFFDSHPEQAAFMLQSARAADVYHACSTFKVPGHRAQENVGLVQSLWLDVDGKDYPAEDDVQGLAYMFFKTAGLPAPVVVASGSPNSYHFYWPMTAPVDPKQWKTMASGLRALCLAHGFKADHSRTTDEASVLRTPGTLNHKFTPPAPVQIVRWAEATAPAVLWAALAPHAVAQPARTPSPGRLGPLLQKALGGLDKLMGGQPSNPDLVAAKCQQIAWATTHQADVKEPLWHLLCGVANFVEEGEDVIHEWSSSHPGYSEYETDKKYQGWNAEGPPTCTAFDSKRPGGCAGCPFAGTITTPVQLGREVAKPAPVATTPVPEEAKSICLPDGFVIHNGALCFATEDKQGKPIFERVCYPVCGLIDFGKRQTDDLFVATFRHYLPGDRAWEDFSIDSSSVRANGAEAIFAGNSVMPQHRDYWKVYVANAITKLKEDRPVSKLIEKMGWVPEGFILGNVLLPSDPRQSATILPVASNFMQVKAKTLRPAKPSRAVPEPSLENWLGAVRKLFLCTKGQATRFAVLCSLAAPLMDLMDQGEGGSILALFTPNSSTGKTLTLTAAATVWGDREALEIGNRSSITAQGAVLGALRHLPVMVDELVAYDAEPLTDFIRMFTDGRDKQRLTQNGDLKPGRGEWSTILFSASNRSIHAQLATADASAKAMANRVLELELELDIDKMKKDKISGDDIMSTLRANAGFLGGPYMLHVVQNQDYYRDSVRACRDVIRAQMPHLPNEFRYWVRLAACAYVAARIVQKFGWFEVDLTALFKGWLFPLISSGPSTVHVSNADTQLRDALDLLQDFVAYHHNQILRFKQPFAAKVIQVPENAPGTVRTPIVGRREASTNRLWLNRTAFRDWVTSKGQQARTIEKALTSAGVLNVVPPSRQMRTLGAGTEWQESGRVYCLEFNTASFRMSVEDEAEVETPSNVVPFTGARPQSTPGASPASGGGQGLPG